MKKKISENLREFNLRKVRKKLKKLDFNTQLMILCLIFFGWIIGFFGGLNYASNEINFYRDAYDECFLSTNRLVYETIYGHFDEINSLKTMNASDFVWCSDRERMLG